MVSLLFHNGKSSIPQTLNKPSLTETCFMMATLKKNTIKNNIEFIRGCVALAPLFGVLGTIIGMIEVFHILAVTGGGDAKAMAGGVARSTIPAMAGLMAAIPASIAARWLDTNVKKKTALLSERLTYE